MTVTLKVVACPGATVDGEAEKDPTDGPLPTVTVSGVVELEERPKESVTVTLTVKVPVAVGVHGRLDWF